jgi:streptogramin lyase
MGEENAMQLRDLLTVGLGTVLIAILCTVAGPGGTVMAQAPSSPPPAPNQPWGLPPPPPGVGPVEKFADVSNTPQGQFLEGGAFDTQGNLWFVAIGSGWISYLTPDGKLVPVVNCNPPAELGQTCEPQGTRWLDGKLYLTTRHRGILVYDPQTKELKTLVYTYRNQLFKGPNDLDFGAEANLFFTDPWGTGPGPNTADRTGPTMGCPQCQKDPLHLTFAGVKAGSYVPGNGGPDGIHYDAKGNLWAQLARLGGIVEIDPRGIILGFVPIPNGDVFTTRRAAWVLAFRFAARSSKPTGAASRCWQMCRRAPFFL